MTSELQDLRKALAMILYKKSYMSGDFTLTSGRKSDYYFDCRQSSLYPESAYLIGEIFYHMLKGKGVDAVAGMTMGADPLVTATSLAAYRHGEVLPALIVRKEPKGHGTASAIEGMGNVVAGQKVVVLEDVVSTGGSVLKACTYITEAGLLIADIFCILDREEGGAGMITSAGYPLHSIFSRQELLSFIHQ